MAQAMMLICDDCGSSVGVETLKLTLRGKTVDKDLCTDDLLAYLENSRKPKRGRKPNTMKAA